MSATLRDMVNAHPTLFYRGHVHWWEAESFMDRPAQPWHQITGAYEVDATPRPPIYAADLAGLYLADPSLSVWRRFLWTDDIDRWGNRVYVGGVGQYNTQAFQIHRHLAPEAFYPRLV